MGDVRDGHAWVTRGTSTLYQHGLTLEIQGDFASTLDYLRRIEGSEWQLLWDRLEYRVAAGPHGSGVVGLSVPPSRGIAFRAASPRSCRRGQAGQAGG